MPYVGIKWEEQLPEIKRLGSLGWGMSKIGKQFGVSRQRIKQIVDKYIPEWNETYGKYVAHRDRKQKYFQKWGEKQPTDLYREQRAKFRAKKYNAVRTGYEWDVEFGDITWPKYCPILNIELDYFSEYRNENSVSFDRIDNQLGYVKGNVIIVSWRANRIKNDGTAEEHRQIANYLDAVSHSSS